MDLLTDILMMLSMEVSLTHTDHHMDLHMELIPTLLMDHHLMVLSLLTILDTMVDLLTVKNSEWDQEV